jgi:hypothetical protein
LHKIGAVRMVFSRRPRDRWKARARFEAVGGSDLGKTIHDAVGHPRVLCARRREELPV